MKHKGGCHCGAVRFEAQSDLKEVMSCNCSICQKRGHLLSFVPENAFTLLEGKNHLSDYQWGKKNIHFLFCKVCGVASFGQGTGPDGNKMVAINARCLEDVDLKSIPVVEFDGRSL